VPIKKALRENRVGNACKRIGMMFAQEVINRRQNVLVRPGDDERIGNVDNDVIGFTAGVLHGGGSSNPGLRIRRLGRDGCVHES
jgi:hypothetical protein